MDATEDYIAGGGRYIYMGGNGYYWNVAFRDDDLSTMEVRKLDSGMRAWSARPGEHYLATTGQKSGLWKNLGRYPYPGFSGTQDYRIRGDITFFNAPNHGTVFCSGSIAFGQALPTENFKNNTSRMLANVVNAFIKPGALPGSLWINEEKQWR